MKIIIIGAGIAGLTLGLACQRAGMQVRIFDKARELRTIGGGILLWPHGLRFLDELGLSECLQPAWMSVKGMNIISHRGHTISDNDPAELFQLLDGEILPIDRSRLQQFLLAELADETLCLGKACADVVNHDDGAEVIFADGSREQADLVVGADGIHSAVRGAVFPDAVPQYTGFCWWGGIVNRDVVPHFPVDEVHFILGQSKFCAVWPTQGERFMWYLPVKIPLESFQQEDDGHALAQHLCQDWNEDVRRMIAAPQMAQRFHVPIYDLPPQHFARGRVVLIGDAASAFGPFLGQGANKAIEDAYLLSTLLKKSDNSVENLLQHYDAQRLSRHERFFELEHLSADALIHETPDALQFFEQCLPQIDLVTMYQDMIPLVNAAACKELKEMMLVIPANVHVIPA